MTDVSDMGHNEHLVLAEEGAVLAGRLEDEFEAFCKSLPPALAASPDMMSVLQMKLSSVQIALAGAQLQATLALVKVAIAMEARNA
jgi:hypothetical protein